MKLIFKWIITFIMLGAIFTIMVFKKLDFEQLFKGEVITVVIVSVIVWLYFIWRRSMRLEETTVNIQFLND